MVLFGESSFDQVPSWESLEHSIGRFHLSARPVTFPPVPPLENGALKWPRFNETGQVQGPKPSKAQGRTVALGARAFRCAHRARGRGGPLPRLSAPPSCILEGHRWHRGSGIKSPGAGLSMPLSPGSLPLGLRPGSRPGSRPGLRRTSKPTFQASALWAVQELRSSEGRASALRA